LVSTDPNRRPEPGIECNSDPRRYLGHRLVVVVGSHQLVQYLAVGIILRD
jgi:hypothetical protein